MRNQKLRLVPGLLCGLLAFSGTVIAQGLATLQGTVTDPSGAVVARARISVVQAGTRQTRSATSDSQGNYFVPSLQPANYTLTVEAPGFGAFVRDVTLQADQSATVNVIMELGQANQAVTVEAAATLVDTTTGTQKQVINQTQMVELPLNGTKRRAAFVPGCRSRALHRGRRTARRLQAVPQPDRRLHQRSAAGPGQLSARRRRLQRRVLLHEPAISLPRRTAGIQRANQQLRRAVRQQRRWRGQHHHEIRHKPGPWRSLRIHSQRRSQRAQLLRAAPRSAQAQSIRIHHRRPAR